MPTPSLGHPATSGSAPDLQHNMGVWVVVKIMVPLVGGGGVRV